MKIAIGKAGVSVQELFNDDTNGRYLEVHMLYEAFIRNIGPYDTVELIDKDIAFKIGRPFVYDKIFVLNNVKEKVGISEINLYKYIAIELNYVLTDLRLLYNECMSLFNKVYTQSTEPIYSLKNKQYYSGMPELASIYHKYCPHHLKENLFAWGGGVRDRKEDMQKYFFNNIAENLGFNLFIKNKVTDTRVPIKVFHKVLENSKYTLVINNKSYNDYGFITWRYYEAICRDVITFLDDKVDRHNIINLPRNIKHFLTVNSIEDLQNKMQILENSESLKNHILREQNKLLFGKKNGKYTVNSLLNLGKENKEDCDDEL